MAIKYYDFKSEQYGEPQYVGAVLDITEHYWMDGMMEETAVCWNGEDQKIEYHQVGYYGSDGRNMNRTIAEIDGTPETWRAVLRHFKPDAYAAFAKSVTEYKNQIQAGTNATVVKGRKVPKGTKLKVFWVGERETFQSRKYYWMHETETVAGCYDEAGNKVWIKAEYLKNADPIKSPNAKERRKFIKRFIDDKAHGLGAPWERIVIA